VKDYPKTLIVILDRLTNDHEASADYLREDAEEASNRRHHSRRYAALYKYLVVNSEPVIDGAFDNDLEKLRSQVKAGHHLSHAVHVRREGTADYERVDSKRIADSFVLGIFDLETGVEVDL